MTYWTMIKHVSKSNKKAACSFVMSLRPQTTGSEQTTGRREENCAVLGHYAASSGNSIQTFLDNLSGPIFKGVFRFLALEVGTDVPKRRQGIATTRCVINQKRAVLISLAAEARYHANYWTSLTLKSQFDLLVVSLGAGAVLREQIRTVHGLPRNIYF
jgi:hypothetical protein